LTVQQIGGCGVIGTMRLLPILVSAAFVSTALAAQVPTPTPSTSRPTFEVASIKPNRSGETRSGANAQPGGRVTVINVSLHDLVRNVYQLQSHELAVGERAPSWITSERWDILAKGPEQATQRELLPLLQNLLVDRFALMTRREVRDVPVYALVVARSDRRLGAQMKPSTLDCAALAVAARDAAPGAARRCGRTSGPGLIETLGVPLGDLARTLSAVTGRFVVDATELPGPFDVRLTWTPDQGAGNVGAATDGASLFTAIQEQLGLRLEPRQAPVNVLVIESAERPKEE
jgi:uncharacterized protein (TIGR03435 family)